MSIKLWWLSFISDFSWLRKDVCTFGTSMPILRSQLVDKSNEFMKEWCSRSLLLVSDKKRSTIPYNDLLKKITVWVVDIPVVLLLDFGCDRFIKSVCKTFAFRIMNKEVFNKLWNSIYNEILCFISMHWISCSYSGIQKLFSKSFRYSLPVDRNDWLLSNICKAWIISALGINYCKFVWCCRSDWETVMLPVWLQPSAVWLFDSFTVFWYFADFSCCLTFSLSFCFTEKSCRHTLQNAL